MRDRIRSLTRKAADILQLQFTKASLDRPLVGPELAPRVADEQESPARIPLVQDGGSIQCEQVVLGRGNGPYKAGDEKFLPRPQSSAQRGCGCRFQLGGRNIDTVPHYVSVIRS